MIVQVEKQFGLSQKLYFPEYKPEFFVDGSLLQNRLEGLVSNQGDVKLVITDNSIPGITGSELIAKYAKKFSFPFILHYAGLEDIGTEAVKNGAAGYMIKPATYLQFKYWIEKALEHNK